jgi:alkanesulfonate monooxygenase SsuD/methylene tetrahydromethanopterin reductase-like flavin-dependent oxidoreductase (luciferase family)
VLLERPATQLGPVGLILPTLPQNTIPAWATAPSVAVDGGAEGPEAPTGNPMAGFVALCQQAEALGASALWATDHLFWHGAHLECMVALTVAATATRQAQVGTCVMQLPLRHASAVAKQAAAIQQLSGGRFVLGVGVGVHEGEYQEAGVDYHTRGRQLDAGIAELRRSWHSGDGVSLGDIAAGGPTRYRQLPAPAAVPVWVGGSSEAALHRAARVADGWMPLFLEPTQYSDALQRLGEETARVGRDPGAVTPSMVLFVSIDDDVDKGRRRGTEWMSSMYGIPAKAFERHLVAGTASEVAETVATFRRAGAEHVALYITEDEPLDQFERLATALPAAGIDPRT